MLAIRLWSMCVFHWSLLLQVDFDRLSLYLCFAFELDFFSRLFGVLIMTRTSLWLFDRAPVVMSPFAFCSVVSSSRAIFLSLSLRLCFAPLNLFVGFFSCFSRGFNAFCHWSRSIAVLGLILDTQSATWLSCPRMYQMSYSRSVSSMRKY